MRATSESAPAAIKFQIRITDFLYDFYTSVHIKTKLVRYVKVNVQSLPLHGTLLNQPASLGGTRNGSLLVNLL
jgi:hypothetical protein